MTVAEQLKQEGEQIGVGKGIEQRNEAIARNALQQGADVEFVAKITGLSLDQVKAIKARIEG